MHTGTASLQNVYAGLISHEDPVTFYTRENCMKKDAGQTPAS